MRPSFFRAGFSLEALSISRSLPVPWAKHAINSLHVHLKLGGIFLDFVLFILVNLTSLTETLVI